jgi:hypothetical protein
VVAATEAGLYRLADGSWQRLDMSTQSGRPAPGSSPSRFVAAIAAMSSNEIWAANWPTGSPQEDGLFRFDGDTWQRQQLPVGATVGQVVVGPDGALWAATASGPLVRRDGDWINWRHRREGGVRTRRGQHHLRRRRLDRGRRRRVPTPDRDREPAGDAPAGRQLVEASFILRRRWATRARRRWR